MSDLEWRETPEGYESNGYRISRLDRRPRPRWLLEASDSVAPWLGSRSLTSSIHVTLRDAKDRARRDERERIRRARVTGHFVVAVAASLTFALSSAALAQTPVGFVVAVILVYVALRSFADAAGVWLGDAWGWTRDRGGPEHLPWSGRWVLAMVEGLHRRSLASTRAEPTSPIVTLPPESSE